MIGVNETESQEWAEKMLKLLIEIKKAVDTEKEASKECLEPLKIEEFEVKYSSILKEGIKEEAETIGKKIRRERKIVKPKIC